jgi:transposase
MKKLIIEDSQDMRIALQQEINRSEDSRYDHRLHGALLVSSGLSCYEVANLFGHSPRSVQYWIKRFNEYGFSGLQDVPRSGRPSAMTPKMRKEVEKHLRKSPKELGYQQNLWDGKLLSHHFMKFFHIDIGVRQCQRLFHEFGFRYRKPRPVIAQSNPVLEKAYKKTRKDTETEKN